MCVGHFVIAAGFVVLSAMPAGGASDKVVFESRVAGHLTVTRLRGGEGSLYELDFPSRPAAAVPAAAAPAALLLALRLDVAAVRYIGRARDWLVEVASAAVVLAVCPDLAALNSLDALCVIVSAPADPGSGADVVSRVFCPNCAVSEDPVTGSAHCTIVPHWAAKLGRRALVARQLSSRGGDITCELRGDRVFMAGVAALFMTGSVAVG